MKTTSKKIFTAVFIAFLFAVCFSIASSAAEESILSSITYDANVSDANTAISVQTAPGGAKYLFLPASADLENLVLSFDAEAVTVNDTEIRSGEAFDLTEICNAVNGEYTITVSGEKLIIMKSENIRSLFYVSNDPVNAGREWVDAVKGNEAEGKMTLLGADGEVDYTDKISEIKARGNSTFTKSAKKAYQFKMKNKADLINNNPEEACKKWILLANMFDSTLIHNSVTFRLAAELEMPYTPHYEAVDLYYDGEYRGSYLLCEKTEVDSSRIDIDDTDKAVEKLNEDTAAYENPIVLTKTTASKGKTDAAANSNGSYKYVRGLTEPAFPEGATHHAYLLELEFKNRYPDELTGFVTENGQCVVTKNPEYLTKETGAYISAFWQEFEDAVYSKNGYNAKTGKYYYEYCDLESLVKLYFINEFSKNSDGFISSTYFYMPADEDIMYAGPIWDFDPAYGSGGTADGMQERTSKTDNFHIAENYLVDGLLEIESFRNALKETLNKENGEFYLAVQNMIGEDGYVYTMSDEIRASQLMNSKLWDVMYYKYIIVHSGEKVTFENATRFMNDYIEARINWLADTVSSWNGDNYSITLDYPEKAVEEELSFFEKIIAFFQSIIEWFMNLFK